jgi:hypothetical protein
MLLGIVRPSPFARSMRGAREVLRKDGSSRRDSHGSGYEFHLPVTPRSLPDATHQTHSDNALPSTDGQLGGAIQQYATLCLSCFGSMSIAILLKGSSMIGSGMSGTLAGFLAVDFWHFSHVRQCSSTSRYIPGQ